MARTHRNKPRPEIDTPERVMVKGVGLAPGVSRDESGAYRIPEATMNLIAQDIIDRAAVSSVPTQPRMMTPDLGGATVDKAGVLPHHLSFTALRNFAIKSPLIQMIHTVKSRLMRQYAVMYSGVRGSVGFRVCHEDQLKPSVQPPKGFDVYVKQAERILRSPAPAHKVYSLGDMISLLEEDLLCINRPSLEILRHPATGQMVGLKPVDGGILYPTMDFLSSWLQRNQGAVAGGSEEDILRAINAAFQQQIIGSEYLLVRDGIVETCYTAGQIECYPMMRVTDIRYAGYQPGHVEMALDLIAAWWMAFDHNTRGFKDGVWAQKALMISGSFAEDNKAEFEAALRERAMGYTNARRLPILWGMGDENAIVKSLDLLPQVTEMSFQSQLEWLATMVCAIYQLDPSYANLKPWRAGASPSLSEGSREQEIENSEASGHETELTHHAEALTRILKREIHPDLIVRVEFGKENLTAEERTRKSRVEYDKTRNESRLEAGDRALGFYLDPESYDKASDEDKKRHDANPWNMPKDPVFVQQAAAVQQAEMARTGAAATADEGSAAMVAGAPAGKIAAPAVVRKPRKPSGGKAEDVADDEADDEGDDEDSLEKGAWAVLEPDALDDWMNY